MRTFAWKPKAPHRSDGVSASPRRQGTLGNQTEQRPPEARTGDVEGAGPITEIARSGHDFSRIPVHAAVGPTGPHGGLHSTPATLESPSAPRSAALASWVFRPTTSPPAPENAPVQRDGFHGPAWKASSESLWYFNGERNDSVNPTEVTLTAATSHAGRFDWQVVEGGDKVEFVVGHDSGHAVSSQDDNRVRVRSKDGSTKGEDDVRIGVAHRDGSGAVRAGEARLGVRTPSTMRATGHTVATPVAAYPDTDDHGAVVDEPEKQKTEDEMRTATALPQSAPSMKHKGATHSSHATFAYETHENYEVLDDKGVPMKGFDVNEKFTTAPTNDAAKCDWRRGAAGGLHAPGSTFFDNMQGEVSSKTPTPQNPQAPLGSTKVQHWTQEWYVGSTTPGKGTKVQTNTFQKYRDHAAHE